MFRIGRSDAENQSMNTNPDTNPNTSLDSNDYLGETTPDALLRAQVTVIAAHEGLPLNEAALLCHIGPDMTITSRIAFDTPYGLRISDIDATGVFFGMGTEAITEVATTLVESFTGTQTGGDRDGNYALVVLNLTADGAYYTPGEPVPDFFSRVIFQQAPTLTAHTLADDNVALTLLEMAENSVACAA